MKRFFTYFDFTKAERRGFSILVFLIFGLFLASAGYGYLKQEHPIAYHLVYLDNNNDGSLFFEFDPNNLPAEDWKKMGFSNRQIAVIKNYEAKGGKFYKKEDVAKIYSISSEEYARIEPYIVIKQNNPQRDRNNTRRDVSFEEAVAEKKGDQERNTYWKRLAKETIGKEMIDVNDGDTSALKSLRGIGSVLAGRIVKYREALGGFHDISQIGEVYGISPEVFQMIQPRLQIGKGVERKLNINTFTKEQLSGHPYVSYKQAALIVNYRTQHGVFADLEDLRNISVLGDDFFRKIEPYIEF